jgi:hypothetical protein
LYGSTRVGRTTRSRKVCIRPLALRCATSTRAKRFPTLVYFPIVAYDARLCVERDVRRARDDDRAHGNGCGMRKLLINFSTCITVAGTTLGTTTSSDKKRRPAPRRLVSVAGLRAPSQANGAAMPLRSEMPQMLDPCLRVVNGMFVIGCQPRVCYHFRIEVHIRLQSSDVWS